MKTLKPSENPSKIQFWIKWLTPVFVITLVSVVSYKVISYKEDQRQESLLKAVKVDTAIMKQYARGINIYNGIVDGTDEVSLSSLGTFSRIEETLKSKKIIYKSSPPLAGESLDLYGDFDFIGYRAKEKEVCESFNSVYQGKGKRIPAKDFSSAYEKIENKSDPFCVTIPNIDKMKGGDYVVVSINEQKPTDSMNIYK